MGNGRWRDVAGAGAGGGWSDRDAPFNFEINCRRHRTNVSRADLYVQALMDVCRHPHVHAHEHVCGHLQCARAWLGRGDNSPKVIELSFDLGGTADSSRRSYATKRRMAFNLGICFLGYDFSFDSSKSV
jgi:hypothetical protein